MKTIALLIFFFGSIYSGNGQQFLWSTTKDTTLKWGDRISLTDVLPKMLEFYDHYENHFDGSGYSKSGFIKSFESSQSFKNPNQNTWKSFKTKIYEIKELTVFAFKSNSGKGSSVLVLCISDENVDMVGFSDEFEDGSKINYSVDREKFAKWLKTFLK